MIVNEKWRFSSSFVKILRIVSISLVVIVMGLEVLGLSGIWDIKITNSIAIPMLGVITLSNGFATYKKKKASGMFSICCAIIIIILCIIVFAIKLIK